MMLRRRRVPLARRLITHRLSTIVALFLVGALLGAAVGALTSIRTSTEQAVTTGVEAGVGDRSFVIQSGSGDARTILSRQPDLDYVRDAGGTVNGDETTSDAMVRRIASTTLPLGTLTGGERPDKNGEATVSEALADDLGIAVGDRVEVTWDDATPTTVQVVGTTIDTADSEAKTIVVVDPSLSSAEASVWLSRTDPYKRAPLTTQMDLRAITYQPTSSLVESALAHGPNTAPVLRWGPAVVGAMLGTLVLAVVAGFVPGARRTATTMLAVGLSLRRTWWTIVGVAAAAISVGVLFGAATAYATLRAASGQVSALFGQAWLSVSFPLSTVLLLVGLAGLLAALSRPIARIGGLLGRSSRRWSLVSSRTDTAAGLRAATGLTIVVIAVILSRLENPPAFAGVMGLTGGVVFASGLPALVVRLCTASLGPASRRVSARLTAVLRVVVAAAMSVAIVAGAYSASQRHNVDASRDLTRPLQPAGSLAMLEVPSAAASTVLLKYRELGGREALRFMLPLETKDLLRVTSPTLLACMKELDTLDPSATPDECWPQETFAPTNSVALDERDGAQPRADPDLVRSGQVGLLYYGSVAGQTPTSLAVTDAAPDEQLGGNLPGLVIAADSAVARRFNLRPAGTEVVTLLDFERLSGREQAQLRATISKVAPAAQVASADEADLHGPDERQATAVGIVAAAITALIMLIGGLAALAGERETRRLLADIGIAARMRIRLLVPWAALPLATMAAAAAVTWLCALALETTLPGDRGMAWTAPLVAGAVAALILIPLAIRVPAAPEDS